MKVKLIILTLILLSAVFLNANFEIIVHATKSSMVGEAVIKARHVSNAWESHQYMEEDENYGEFLFYDGTFPYFGSPYALCEGRNDSGIWGDEDIVPWTSPLTHIYLKIDPINIPIPDDPPAGN